MQSMPTQSDPRPPPDTWHIQDGNKTYGPITWQGVMFHVNSKKITNRANIKNEVWPNWVPITYYVHSVYLADPETMGLLPSRYDAIFYGGVFLFMVGFIAMIVNPFMGLPIVALSTVIEIYAIWAEGKNRPKSLTSTMGNLFAGVWIGIQIFATAAIAMMRF